MPKLHSKEPTLNGKAEIVSYEDREYLYLRIPRGDRKYWNRSLQTTDLKVAHDRALDVYIETVNAPQKSRSKKHLFTTACEKFLAHKHKQASTGKITSGTASTYEQRFYQRITRAFTSTLTRLRRWKDSWGTWSSTTFPSLFVLAITSSHIRKLEAHETHLLLWYSHGSTASI